MRLAPFALLTTAAALLSGPGAASLAPNSADVTIKTRTTFGGQQAETVVLQLKGARQRVERVFEAPSAPPGGVPVYVTQCDARRLLIRNDQMRLYAYVPLHERGQVHGVVLRSSEPDTRPIAETVTIDAVDTGERRTFGALVARRVITRTTTERHPGGAPVLTRVRDGWYLDLPSPQCDESVHGAGETMLFATGSVGRPEIKWKGTARTGWPVTETDRHVSDHGTFIATTSLVEFSDAPLDPALFDVPPGYRPALPLGAGNFDLTRPDSVANRVRLVGENAVFWVHHTWSRFASLSWRWPSSPR